MTSRFEIATAYTVTSKEGCTEYWFFTLDKALQLYREASHEYSDLKINISKVKYNSSDWNDFYILEYGTRLKPNDKYSVMGVYECNY